LTNLVSTLLRVYEYDTTDHVVALHNTFGSTYGAQSYLPGTSGADEVSAVVIQGGASPHLYLTQRSTYDKLLASKALISMVLQTTDIVNVLKRKNASNQGSMSVFARDKNYFNTETVHGVLYDQFLHLKTLVDIVIMQRYTEALPQVRIEPGQKYCYDRLARTGRCVPTGSKCVGDIKSPQTGCSSTESCCVMGGCTVPGSSGAFPGPAAPGNCVADADCPGGAGTPSSAGAIGCESDAAAIKCCTTWRYAAVPPVVAGGGGSASTTTRAPVGPTATTPVPGQAATPVPGQAATPVPGQDPTAPTSTRLLTLLPSLIPNTLTQPPQSVIVVTSSSAFISGQTPIIFTAALLLLGCCQ
jgi:hypothetical protein